MRGGGYDTGGPGKPRREERAILPIDGVELLDLFGQNDENLRAIQNGLATRVVARGESLRIEGPAEEVALLREVLESLIARVREGARIDEGDVRHAVALVRDRRGEELVSLHAAERELHSWKGVIQPRTAGQSEYVRAIQEYDLVFAIGPAGTGKTYLAMAAAVAALRQRQVDRVILVRPAVEAGESLGFLPGDFTEKVGPYLRPLYDALYEMMPSDKIKRSIDMGVIEVAPLAYMRGRTLNSSFVILDEAQNTTLDQLKMFLTRLGFRSKAVITGDVTQVDLPDKSSSGLVQIPRILGRIPGLRIIHLEESDVVRHRLVAEIIRAFSIHEAQGGAERNGETRNGAVRNGESRGAGERP